jgi:sec-independent protein translocase protein TatC
VLYRRPIAIGALLAALGAAAAGLWQVRHGDTLAAGAGAVVVALAVVAVVVAVRELFDSRAVAPDSHLAQQQPLRAHLVELRRRLYRAALAVLAGGVVGYVAFVPLLDRLIGPYCALTVAYTTADGCALVALSPLQPLSIRLHGALLVGLVLAWPVVSWQLWRFVVPGLTRTERRWALMMAVSGQVLLVGGVVLAFVMVQTALSLLLVMAGPSVVPMLDATAYLRFLVTLAISFGLLFQTPLVLVGLVVTGLLSTATLRQRRREALVIGAVVAAVVTPTGDAVTLGFALGILAVLYELAIVIGRVVERRRARRAR